MHVACTLSLALAQLFVQAVWAQGPSDSSSSSSAQTPNNLAGCLQSKLSPQAKLEAPSNPNFLVDTIRWTSLGAPTFGLVVDAATEGDIAASISCATKYNTSFLATGPRHGYSLTLASVQNGLEINTGFLNHTQVDTNANTITAGGAVIFQQAIDALYAVGKELPTGSCSCVGLLGGSLGGGVGRLSGLHGLVLDSLLSVRLMLPNTTIVTVSQQSYPDLFWGIRGAGFNFGVVLEATFQVYNQVPNGLHLNADFKFNVSQVASFYQKFAQESKNLPKELAILSLFNLDPDYNQTVITVNAVYAGPEAAGRKAVQFLIDQNPLVQNITVVPWNKLIQTAGFGFTGPAICQRGNRHSQWAIGVNQIDAPTYSQVLAKFQEMITKYPAASKSSVDVQMLPTQGILAVPDNATSYAYRSFVAHVLLEFEYTDSSLDNAINGYAEQIRDIVAKTAGTNGLEVYVSYSHGDESIETLYSAAKLPRLAGLKKQYDPSGLFDAYHPLPTSYP